MALANIPRTAIGDLEMSYWLVAEISRATGRPNSSQRFGGCFPAFVSASARLVKFD
jgi:hypothetical protein